MAILTVTLNPALDLETRTPRLSPGDKLRCENPRRDPGGGGINVARAIALLGGQATAVVAAGGATGQNIAEALRGLGIPLALLPAPGETRSNLSVIETATGHQYRFIFPGPVWTSADLDAAGDGLTSLLTAGDFVVLSGSLPPGVSGSDLVRLSRRLNAKGAHVIADTSGEALTTLAETAAGLRVLRMDSVEAEELIKRPLATRRDSADTAEGLVKAGAAEIVIVARGAEGSVLVTRDGRWFAPAIDVPVVSVTGAGDSFVAGAILALSKGYDPGRMVQWGAAAASAAVTTEATALCDPEMFHHVLPQCPAEKI
ncbi:MAG: 1-phosphofructokinase family hexose kinase [Pseudomonadota bacterium]